jgi:hypothetical protein
MPTLAQLAAAPDRAAEDELPIPCIAHIRPKLGSRRKKNKCIGSGITMGGRNQ